MTWRLAKSLETLRREINEQFPNRHKSSDGTIGDEKHASRSSDHNPWVKDGKTGVVTAIDFTHDPEQGIDSEKLAETLRASRDSRIKYIISNRKIANSGATGGAAAWAWRTYTGSNPHNKHMHLSVKSDKASYDSTKPWNLPFAKQPKSVPVDPAKPAVLPVLDEIGAEGDRNVWNVQRRLKAMMYSPGGLDGIWGGMTAGAISGFINDRGLKIAPPTTAKSFNSILEPLRTELAKAEAERFTRPIAPERAAATPEQLAPKLPEVQASITAERLTFWGAITAFVSSTLTGIAKFMGDAMEWLTKIKDFAGDIPWYWWTGLAVGVSALMYFVSLKMGDAKNAATKAYQEGERV